MVSIFKQKRIKGWWPFVARNEEDEFELTVSPSKEQYKNTKSLQQGNITVVLGVKSGTHQCQYDSSFILIRSERLAPKCLRLTWVLLAETLSPLHFKSASNEILPLAGKSGSRAAPSDRRGGWEKPSWWRTQRTRAARETQVWKMFSCHPTVHVVFSHIEHYSFNLFFSVTLSTILWLLLSPFLHMYTNAKVLVYTCTLTNNFIRYTLLVPTSIRTAFILCGIDSPRCCITCSWTAVT